MSRIRLCLVIVSMNGHDGKLSYKSEIISRGFVYIKESSHMFEKAEKLVLKVTEEYKLESQLDFTSFKSKIKSALKSYFYNETQRKPMIVVRIIEK